jgi:hypothetical protein
MSISLPCVKLATPPNSSRGRRARLKSKVSSPRRIPGFPQLRFAQSAHAAIFRKCEYALTRVNPGREALPSLYVHSRFSRFRRRDGAMGPCFMRQSEPMNPEVAIFAKPGHTVAPSYKKSDKPDKSHFKNLTILADSFSGSHSNPT